jgi:hypothetical protein
MLERVVQKCLQKDPNGRYQTIEELVDALRLVLETRDAGARPQEDLPSASAEEQGVVLLSSKFLTEIAGPEEVSGAEVANSSDSHPREVANADDVLAKQEATKRPRLLNWGAAPAMLFGSLFGLGASHFLPGGSPAMLPADERELVGVADDAATAGVLEPPPGVKRDEQPRVRADAAVNTAEDASDPRSDAAAPTAAVETVRKAQAVRSANERRWRAYRKSRNADAVVEDRYALEYGTKPRPERAASGASTLKNPYPSL